MFPIQLTDSHSPAYLRTETGPSKHGQSCLSYIRGGDKKIVLVNYAHADLVSRESIQQLLPLELMLGKNTLLDFFVNYTVTILNLLNRSHCLWEFEMMSTSKYRELQYFPTQCPSFHIGSLLDKK